MSVVFVDASALVSMTTGEDDDEALVVKIANFRTRRTSAIAFWEAASAIARKRDLSIKDAGDELHQFAAQFDIAMSPIGLDEARGALVAWHLYGKRSGHPARLNMGDCFAYACAKTNNAHLLYKGDDFAKTDLG